MKIALLGYGKMGQAIEALLSEYGHTCVGKFNSENPATIEKIREADVAIEFSTPEQCSKNIALCFEANVPVVVGTTAWYEQYDEVISKMKSDSAILSATNFSIGVQITFHLNKELARVMSKFPEYTASIEEIHHTAKLDKPSGTAITLAEGILENSKNLTSWKLEDENGEEKLREGKRREELTTKFQLRSRNYAIGIKYSIFQLRSRNKTEGFPSSMFPRRINPRLF